MSIIYDALKKVEESSAKNLGAGLDKSSKSMPKKIATRFSVVRKVFYTFLYHKKIPEILIYVLVICLGFFVANIFFGFFVTKDRSGVDKKLGVSVYPELPKEIPEDKMETKKELPASFVLNCVFFSGDEGYALINNRVVKKGDVIDGATVVGIALDEVDLEAEGSVINLRFFPSEPP